MHVAEHVQVSDFVVLKREDRHAYPPDVSTTGRYTEQLFAMMAMEAHFATHARPFLDHGQNVGGVRTECRCDEINVAGKAVMPDECRAERAPEREVPMKQGGDEAFVRAIPQLLVKNANHFLLRRQLHAPQV